MKSLRLRLAVSLVLISITVVGSAAGLLHAEAARRVRGEFDRGLVESGRFVEAAAWADGIDSAALAALGDAWSIRTPNGALLAGAGAIEPGTSADTPAFADGPGALRRVWWTTAIGNEPAVVTAARDTSGLDETLGQLQRRYILLGLAACLLLGGLIVWQVAVGFAPLWRLARRSARTGVDELSLDSNQLPLELRPFVTRYNELVERLRGALGRERQFTGHVAHELRTPLAVLRTGIELMIRKEAQHSDARGRLEDLLGTVDDMGKMVENLLMLARVEQGAETTQLSDIELRPIVDNVWRQFEGRAEARDLSFENRLAKDHTAKADPGKLHIVLQNLIGNAVSYTERGGTIAIEANGDEVVSVWDSGPQLEQDEIERVFDRMWRADLARTDAAQHAGLGLSLVRALCRHMRMEVVAENVDGGGLRFVVTPRYRYFST